MKRYIGFPVKYYYGTFYDSNGKMVADFFGTGKGGLRVRGWGWISNLFRGKQKHITETPEELQDQLGEWIADAINQKLKKENENS